MVLWDTDQKSYPWLPLEYGKKLGFMKDIPAKEGMQRDLQAVQGNSMLHDTPGSTKGETVPDKTSVPPETPCKRNLT